MNNDQSPDFLRLIPEMAEWNGGAGINVDGWLSVRGGFPLAIGFSTLFWPRFVEFDGCVLFEGFSVETFQGFMLETKGNRAAVEEVKNHRHLMDIFCLSTPVPTVEQLEYLGEVLRDAWEVKLARVFPQRRVRVSFERGMLEDLLGYVVTFWQRANEASIGHGD